MTMEEAFNEWMRRYIEEPERFEVEWKTITQFVAEDLDGGQPEYGSECAAYLRQLMSEG